MKIKPGLKNTASSPPFQALTLKQVFDLAKDYIIEIKLKDVDKTICCKIVELLGKAGTVARLDIIENREPPESENAKPIFSSKLISEKQIESVRIFES